MLSQCVDFSGPSATQKKTALKGGFFMRKRAG